MISTPNAAWTPSPRLFVTRNPMRASPPGLYTGASSDVSILSSSGGCQRYDCDSAPVGGRCLNRVPRGLYADVRLSRCSIRIGREDIQTVLEARNKRTALRNDSDQQREFAHRDGLTAAFTVSGGIL